MRILADLPSFLITSNNEEEETGECSRGPIPVKVKINRLSERGEEHSKEFDNFPEGVRDTGGELYFYLSPTHTHTHSHHPRLPYNHSCQKTARNVAASSAQPQKLNVHKRFMRYANRMRVRSVKPRAGTAGLAANN